LADKDDTLNLCGLTISADEPRDPTEIGSELWDLHVISGVKIHEQKAIFPAVCRQIKRLTEQLQKFQVTHESLKVTVDIRDVYRRLSDLEMAILIDPKPARLADSLTRVAENELIEVPPKRGWVGFVILLVAIVIGVLVVSFLSWYSGNWMSCQA